MSKNKKGEDWQKLNEIFAAAIELDEGSQGDFLSRTCAGDENLRREVEAVIAASKRADAQDFLQADAFRAGAKILAENDNGNAPTRKLIGKYKIIREIGRGGMGAIYLAEREDFHHRVALKIIKRGMDTDEIIRRFEREREVLAALNHPNIARLFDGGTTDDGLPFLVMEYIEGEPITEYCDRKKLGIEERLALFRKICEAVSFAHQNLIVHRDIKPSNILVDENGEPKLLDFGIAKLLAESSDAQTLTSAGMRLMTPEYASPEQARGERITTASDIYSLGVLLYELLSGHRPFHLTNRPSPEVLKIISEQEPPAPSTAALTTEKNRIASETDKNLSPETLADLRRERPHNLRRRLSGDLDNITLKALRKEPGERYESAEQFSEDIRRHLTGLPIMARSATAPYRAIKFVRRNRAAVVIGAMFCLLIVAVGASWAYFLWRSPAGNNKAQIVSSQDARRKIAVLPFGAPNSNLGMTEATAAISSAVAERLGTSGQIQLTPSDTVQTERASNDNLLLTGQKLGAESALTGKFFDLDEKKIYLRLHLISVGDGEILWAQTYNVPRGELSALLDEIEHNVSLNLRKLAAPEEYEQRARKFTQNREAYQLYLQGRFLWRMRDDILANNTAAVDCFERAIKLDPNFALPYVGLADVHKTQNYHDPAWRRAEEMAQKALQLTPGWADAHATLGFIKMFHHWDWAGAENEFQKALSLDADCLNARQWYALMLALRERHQEAAEQIAHAKRIAPYSINIQQDEAQIKYFARLYNEAILISRDLREKLSVIREPASAYWQLGDYEKAVEAYIDVGWAGDKKDKDKIIALFKRDGEKEFVRYAIAYTIKTNSALRSDSTFRYGNAYRLAHWYAVLDERERTLDLLEQAVDEHHFFIIYLKANPHFKNLHDEPRFQALLKRIGLSN